MSQRVFIAEDDPLTHRLLTRSLTKWGYRVETAEDGEQGLEKLKENLPDLMITDILMPYNSGLELIWYLREQKQSRVPIIVLTAATDRNKVLEAQKLGADALLRKPFSQKELKACTERLLGK